MENLFDLDIDHIKHGGTEVTLMKLNGDIIYKKAPYYVPYQFRGDTSLVEVETNVGKRNTSLSNMFAGCSNLVSVNTQDWNTSNVTTMERTFYYCGSLTELDLSNLDTSRVTNMYQTFAECNSLRILNVSNWDISRVTNMRGIFGWSEKLETLDLSNWVLPDSTNVQNLMDNMFYNCNSLQNLRLDNCDSNTIRWLIDQNPNNSAITSFPTNAIEGVTRTIYCKRENALGITVPANWVFRYVNIEGIPEYLLGEFYDQKYLTSIETDVNASHTDLSSMLYRCKALISVNTEDWDTSNVTDMSWMFGYCESLPELDLSNFNTGNVTKMGWMFCGCHSLEELNVSNFDTSNVTDMVCMFDDCQSLISLDLSNWDTGNVIDMQNMFCNCYRLTELDLSNFDTSKVKYMRDMFLYCYKLQLLDLSNWNMDSIVTSVAGGTDNMFGACLRLHSLRLDNCSADTISKIIDNLPTKAIDGVTKTIYCKEENVVGLTPPENWVFNHNLNEKKSVMSEVSLYYIDGEFTERKDLVDVETIVTSSHTNLSGMFSKCTNLTIVNGTDKWNTSNVNNMNGVFASCNSLTSLDLSSFDTSNVTDMNSMFIYCYKLTELNLSSFNTNKVTDMSWMFEYCKSLISLDLSNFDITNSTNVKGMFKSCSKLRTLHLDNCDWDTINKIINSTSFPALNYGTIYCKEANAEGLTAPGNWNFSYID